jgi:Asp/Glu/hydantoin racemase
MGARVAILAPMGLDPEVELLRQIIQDVFVRNAEKVKEEGTEIAFHALNRGFTDIDYFGYRYFNARNDYELLEAAIKLEGEGFDALVIHCAFDSMLQELRQALDIPVVGVLQAGILLATMMGYRFGVVTFSNTVVPLIEELIVRYGLRDKAVRVRSTESSGMDMMLSLGDAHDIIDTFAATARACIADGAEVLVPG